MAKGKISEFKKSKQRFTGDHLRIKRGPKSSSVSGSFTMILFRDKDTGQIVTYLPTLEVTGYGSTESKAIEMLKFSITNLFEYLVDLPVSKMASELKKLGWKHNDRIKAKEYSNTYIDIRGELQNFNAVGDKVEVSVLAV